MLAGLVISTAAAAHSKLISKLVDRTVALHPNALWHIVHDLCMVDMKTSGHPAPCAAVDLSTGYAVLKDIQGDTQYLLIPTARVTGIESPALLGANSPNYWQAAWSARRYFEASAGSPVPRADIGLAVNSAWARTQDQLHIHIDCVRPDVRDALAAHGAEIGAQWSRLKFDLAGSRYFARRIDGADLGDRDPFKMLAAADPLARADMGRETLVVIGVEDSKGGPGFVVLSDRAGDAGKAAGEQLLDHGCAVLSKGARPASD